MDLQNRGFNSQNVLLPFDIQDYNPSTKYHYSLSDCHSMTKLTFENSVLLFLCVPLCMRRFDNVPGVA